MSAHTIRSLAVERTGDFFKKKIKPRIRLHGQWLERAGFKPNSRVSVKILETGVIQIRAI